MRERRLVVRALWRLVRRDPPARLEPVGVEMAGAGGGGAGAGLAAGTGVGGGSRRSVTFVPHVSQ
jgi:hypothetical protein